MNERVDEILQHYGVPGMRWGKRKAQSQKYGMKDFKKDRKEIGKQIRSKQISKKDGAAKIQDNIHKVNMSYSKAYRKAYDKNISKGRTEKSARIRADIKRRRANHLKLTLAAYTAAGAMTVGKGVLNAASDTGVTESAVRAGKNAMLTAQGSKLRYPKPSDIKNVIN